MNTPTIPTVRADGSYGILIARHVRGIPTYHRIVVDRDDQAAVLAHLNAVIYDAYWTGYNLAACADTDACAECGHHRHDESHTEPSNIHHHEYVSVG